MLHRADVPKAASRPLVHRSCRTLGPNFCCSGARQPVHARPTVASRPPVLCALALGSSLIFCLTHAGCLLSSRTAVLFGPAAVLSHTRAWSCSLPQALRLPGSRRLTPPSSGRPKGRFAPFGPPLMSNVGPQLVSQVVRVALWSRPAAVRSSCARKFASPLRATAARISRHLQPGCPSVGGPLTVRLPPRN